MTKETMTLLQSLGENEKAAFFQYMRQNGALDIIADLLAAEYHDYQQSKHEGIYNA